MPDEGPFMHSRDLDGYLRQYGVKVNTGQDLLPTLRGTVNVDDVSILTPPVQAPISGCKANGGVDPLERAMVQITPGGKTRGIWILELHLTGAPSIKLETFVQGMVPAFGAVGPTTIPQNLFVANIRSITSLPLGVSTMVQTGTRPAAANVNAMEINVDDVPLFMPFYIPTGLVLVMTGTAVNDSFQLDRIAYQEVPAIDQPDTGA